MREWQYWLIEKDKSVSLDALIIDNYGKQSFRYGSVRGWRKNLLKTFIKGIQSKYQRLNNLKNGDLEFDDSNLTMNWDYNARILVCIKILQASKNYYEANLFIESIEAMSTGEIHFWAAKFLSNKKTKNAFRSLYS